jgi:predicted naringenin-chalcone synthase
MAPPQVFLNRIATAVPPHQVHTAFRAFAERQAATPRDRAAFARMADRSQIARRHSVLEPADEEGSGTACGFYRLGEPFPSTGARMARYEAAAAPLAEAALDRLGLEHEGAGITHLVLASCTGFVAPGLDHQIIARYGLPGHVERTIVGFMGCQAAINALKLAWHQVRSDPSARVLVVCLELCTLHLQASSALEQLLCFALFADGCAAGVVSAEPGGMRLDGFRAGIVPTASDQITWRIGDDGFDMTLSGLVPFTLAHALPEWRDGILGGAAVEEMDLWAVHPGGRSVLDAVAHGLELPQGALSHSRAVLEAHGNMSSATVMFVLRDMLEEAIPGRRGCAMAFGPGLSAETMRFATV